MTEKPHSPFSTWRRWGVAGFVVFGLAIGVDLFAGWLIGDGRATIAAAFVLSLTALIRVSWPLRREGWFWATVAALAATDIATIAYVDWSFTKEWTGQSFGGFAAADFWAMMAIVYGLYRLNYGPPVEPFEEDAGDLPDYADREFDL